jgi:hypothetical protein
MFCDLSYYTLEYRGNHFAYAVYNLNNSNCNDRTFAFSESGRFTLGNEVVTGGGLQAKELNVTASSDGHTNYDLVYIDTANGVMYLGDTRTGDGTTPEKRPTDVRLTVPYSKMP